MEGHPIPVLEAPALAGQNGPFVPGPSQSAQPSAEEAARLRALARYAILDTPPDEGFDDLAALAQTITGRSIAGIAFFDSDRVWVKSLLGADAETCTTEHALGQALTTLPQSIPDPAGWTLHSGSFASVPCITSDGYTLGCLFVADREVFELDEQQSTALTRIAGLTVRLLELRRTLLSFQTIVDKAGHVVFHLDQADRLVSLTPTWSQMTGFGVVRSLGGSLQDFMHPEDQDQFECWLSQVRSSTRPPMLECRLVRLTGDNVMVAVLARPLVDERNRVLGLVGVVADVSEQHARDAEAQHLSKLEALGRLSAGLAHEINTPIQFVGDNTRFLAECCETMLTLLSTYREIGTQAEPILWAERKVLMQQAEAEAELDYLSAEVPVAIQESLDGVERVASLVRAMKMFSHPGSEEQAPADLNESLRSTIIVARNQFHLAEVEFDLQAIPAVMCNIADLNQAFLNLVVNASDAIEEKAEPGTITISTRVDNEDVVVSINDTGNGVPENLKRQIFEPFFTTKPVGRGTGQGLALVRAIVEGHSGGLALESEVGVGTTIIIRLPIQGCPVQTGESR